MRKISSLATAILLATWSVAAAQETAPDEDAVDEAAPTAEEIETPSEDAAADLPCDPSAGGAEDSENDAPAEREAALEGCGPDGEAGAQEGEDTIAPQTN